jgi:hypothetical protein
MVSASRRSGGRCNEGRYQPTAVIHTAPLARSVIPTMKIAVSAVVIVQLRMAASNCLTKSEELGLE